jgi:hypothetical protein
MSTVDTLRHTTAYNNPSDGNCPIVDGIELFNLLV